MRLTALRLRPGQRGLSLVELMVGITVGLIVVAGASMVAVNQINEHRRLMLETQIQQDLRTAADLLQQDIRRAGFRGHAEYSVWAPAMAVGSLNEQPPQPATRNGYMSVLLNKDDSGLTLDYYYARKNSASEYDIHDVPLDSENFGFRWDKAAKTIYLKLGATNGRPNWQPITDPESVRIDDLDVQIATQSVSLGEFCDKPCSPLYPAATAVCPTQEIREVRFTIKAMANHDARVVRTVVGVERIRADGITGSCP